MTTHSARITVGGVDVDVHHKDIKNLHVAVYPPDGRVRVAAPLHVGDEQVRLAVVQRLGWIKRQRKRLQAAERQSEREMVSGESHYVWGRRYRLQVAEEGRRIRIDVDGGRLLMRVPPGTDANARAEALQNWERRQLRQRIPALVEKWAAEVGVAAPEWGIKRMKTKWGTCSRTAPRLWFNSELAKKDPRLLEYIVVHEMVHLVERSHGPRFIELMDGLMSDWRSRRDALNAAPLSDERWAA